MSLQRTDVVSFSLPLFKGENGFFIKNPANKYNYTAYLQPMTLLAWAFIFVFALVTPLAVFGYNKLNPYSANQISLTVSYAWTAMWVLRLDSEYKPLSLVNRIVKIRYEHT